MRKIIASAAAAAILGTGAVALLHVEPAKPTIVRVGDYGRGDPTDAEIVACAANGYSVAINESADRTLWTCEFGG